MEVWTKLPISFSFYEPSYAEHREPKLGTQTKYIPLKYAKLCNPSFRSKKTVITTATTKYWYLQIYDIEFLQYLP